MWFFLLNFRFCFTADRVKIYTNEEKTRWVFPLDPVISRRFFRIKIGAGCFASGLVCRSFPFACVLTDSMTTKAIGPKLEPFFH